MEQYNKLAFKVIEESILTKKINLVEDIPDELRKSDISWYISAFKPLRSLKSDKDCQLFYDMLELMQEDIKNTDNIQEKAILSQCFDIYLEIGILNERFVNYVYIREEKIDI